MRARDGTDSVRSEAAPRRTGLFQQRAPSYRFQSPKVALPAPNTAINRPVATREAAGTCSNFLLCDSRLGQPTLGTCVVVRLPVSGDDDCPQQGLNITFPGIAGVVRLEPDSPIEFDGGAKCMVLPFVEWWIPFTLPGSGVFFVNVYFEPLATSCG
jgi:hypothetical protein